MIVIAHRGASAYAPENTQAAFDLGQELGADAIETDVRATRDGILVLMHDAKVDRTTDGQGPIADKSWIEVQQLDAGRWKAPTFAGQRVPLLDWFLDRYGSRLPLYLEIKAPGVEPATLQAVQEHNLLDRVIFTSFSIEALETLTSLAPVRAAWLIPDWTPDVASRAGEVPLYEVSVSAPVVTPELVQRIKSTGIGCRAWRVSNESLMERAVSAGVDGMTIDFPDVLLRRLGRPTAG